MHVPWDQLHEVLVGSLRTLQSAQQFRTARDQTEALAGFVDAAALVVYLNGEGGEAMDSKDEIYAALVRGVQAGVGWAGVASTMLVLGLWRGLSGVYGRARRRAPTAREELATSIPACLLAVAGRMELGRVHRVAATLVRNTEREVLRERRRAFRPEAVVLVSAGAGIGSHTWRADDPRAGEDAEDWEIEDASAVEAMVTEVELGLLRRRLAHARVPDADLVLELLLHDGTQDELATRLGLSHDAARRRWQRVRDFVRQYFIHFLEMSIP